MYKVFSIYLPIAAIFLLLIATGVLAYYNWNTKIHSLLLTGLFVGTATAFVTIVVGLKEDAIERTFITHVIMDEGQHLPVFVARQPDPLDRRLSQLLTWGNPMRKNGTGTLVSTIKLPSNFDETITYASELLQYSLLHVIQEMHLKIEGSAMTVEASGWVIDPIIHRPVFPPTPKKYLRNDLDVVLKSNRFSNSDSEDFNWENIPLTLPENTTIDLVHIPTSPETGPETHKLILKKPNYFEIVFTIQPSIQPGQGALPRGVSLSPDLVKQSRAYYYVINCKAVLSPITAGNSERDNYKKWIEWMFSEIQNRL